MDPFAPLTVILNVEYVALRNVQNRPPLVVAVVAGSVIALNAEFVILNVRLISNIVRARLSAVDTV
jgi:hypothetical protein